MSTAIRGRVRDVRAVRSPLRPVGRRRLRFVPDRQGLLARLLPNCGYGAPDVARSALAGRVSRAAARLARRRAAPAGVSRVLAEAAPGSQATIETMEDVPARQREQLIAYGLAPGCVVDVLQVRPVTIVRMEHAELAFETALSRAIGIAASTEGGS